MMAIEKAEAPGRLPGERLQTGRMPGHWLLARLGKRVLRPGGLAMTRALLRDLRITPQDDVVELAPGLGLTARAILELHPRGYTGIERDRDAAGWTLGRLPARPDVAVLVGSAEETGLADASAGVVLGEAMLSMNSLDHKQRIMREAFRVLRPGGRYGIHELLIVPDDAPAAVKRDIEDTLSKAIHVGARPLTAREWRDCMEQAGFEVVSLREAPMNLLQPARLFADEGVIGALRFILNVARDGDARRRVLSMRRSFSKYRQHLRGCAIIGRKPADGT